MLFHALSLAALLLGACGAEPVAVRSPEPFADGAGSIHVVFTRPADGVTIALDGRLVVERAETDRVEIADVAPGLAEVVIAAGSGPSRVERHVRVEVDPGRATTIPVAAPDPGGGSGLASAALSIVAVILSRAVTELIF